MRISCIVYICIDMHCFQNVQFEDVYSTKLSHDYIRNSKSLCTKVKKYSVSGTEYLLEAAHEECWKT